MTTTVQISRRGAFTLPKTLRDKYHIATGETFSIIDLGDGNFVLHRGRSQIDDLLDGLRNDLEAGGETLASMLTRLRAMRENRYDANPS